VEQAMEQGGRMPPDFKAFVKEYIFAQCLQIIDDTKASVVF